MASEHAFVVLEELWNPVLQAGLQLPGVVVVACLDAVYELYAWVDTLVAIESLLVDAAAIRLHPGAHDVRRHAAIGGASKKIHWRREFCDDEAMFRGVPGCILHRRHDRFYAGSCCIDD